MISLKVISTLSKKVKIATFFIFILMLSTSLYAAESFRISITGDNSDYCELVSSVVSSFTSLSSDWAKAKREERRAKDEFISLSKRKTEMSQKEIFTEIKTEEKKDEDEVLSLEIATVDFSTYSSFLRTLDSTAYYYLKSTNNLDAIIHVSSESQNGLEKINLIIDGAILYSSWYSKETERNEKDSLYSFFASLFLSPDFSLYSLEVYPSDATILLDNSPLEGDGEHLIMKNGEHTFTLSSYGYDNLVYTASFYGEDERIELTMTESEPFSLFVSTIPYDAELFVNGIKSESKTLDNLYTPFVLSSTRDGFLSLSYQEKEKENHITLTLPPLWTDSANLMEEKKGDFYKNLFYLLLSFGGYTASSSISNLYSPTIGKVTQVVFTGLSFVSLINLIQSAYDYYNSSRRGV